MKNKMIRLGLVVLAVLFVIAWTHSRKPAAGGRKPVVVCGKTN